MARQSGEKYNSLYLRVYTTKLRRLDSANDRQSIIDRLAMSRFMSLLPYDCFNHVFSRNPNTGREAADFVTEFAQTRSFAKRHNHTRFGPHHCGPLGCHHAHGGVASQRLQLDTGKGQINDDTHNHHYRGEHVPTGAESQGVQSSGDSKQKSGASGVHKSGVKSKSIVCHSCGEPGHIRPNCPNRVKRVSSPTLDHSLSRKDSFVKGAINDTPCDKMFIDSGCEVTCVAKHLVPTSAYTGKTTLLKGYKASSQPESHPIAKVRLRLFSYDEVIEAAVVEDITEDVLLGSDLGRATLAKWLLETESSSKCVKLTRAQASTEKIQEEKDKLSLEASGASPHLISDIFNFTDEFLVKIQLMLLPTMVEIFSRSGLPSEILTDRGSVLVGKLMSQLCKMLDIKPIRTSPYHPETDGLLERWHSDLLAMLKKATIDKKDWDLYLPFVLFAYRQTPHTVTGFSPFQLIYGFNVRGPLEILRDNWVDGCVAETTLIDWVEQLKMNLMDFSVIAGDRSALAKCKMKVLYDKSSKPNTSFSPGSMVLVRTPGFSAKFSDSWEGPLEVLRQVTPVTWEISIPNSPRKNRIVHVNMLKEWHTAKVLVRRVVVLEEETPNIYSNSLAKNLTKEQFTQLHEVQKLFGSLLTDTPGSKSLTEIAIITSDAPPFQSCPYRIPSALLNSVRLSLDNDGRRHY